MLGSLQVDIATYFLECNKWPDILHTRVASDCHPVAMLSGDIHSEFGASCWCVEQSCATYVRSPIFGQQALPSENGFPRACTRASLARVLLHARRSIVMPNPLLKLSRMWMCSPPPGNASSISRLHDVTSRTRCTEQCSLQDLEVFRMDGITHSQAISGLHGLSFIVTVLICPTGYGRAPE